MANSYPNPPADLPPSSVPNTPADLPPGSVPYTPADLPPSSVPFTPPNSTTAIISLISGILGLTFIPFLGSIAALITGYMARNEIRSSAGAIGGEGLATAGIVLGWIGVALGIISVCCVGAIILLSLSFIPWTVETSSILIQGSILSLIFSIF